MDFASQNSPADVSKIVIDLETNGTIDPEEAIRSAATILQRQMAVFVALENDNEPEAKVDFKLPYGDFTVIPTNFLQNLSAYNEVTCEKIII